VKPVDAQLLEMARLDYYEAPVVAEELGRYGSREQIDHEIGELEAGMRKAAQRFEFEKAAGFRDRIKHLKEVRLEL
jgi:excinuclease UvrABC helicase subunit UvrB